MYAFIHIPKTAGSTFRHILRLSFGPRHCDIKAPMGKRASHGWIDAADLRRSRHVYPLLDGVAGHRVTCFAGMQSGEPRVRFVTFLRDPHKRLLSHFQHQQRGRSPPSTREDFLAFCADPHQRNVQTRWIGGSEDADAAIDALDRSRVFVGLTEDFDTSLVLFRAWLGHPRLNIHYAPRNRAPNPATLDVRADPELVAAMEEANRADLQLYRHAVDTVFPRQKAAYPGDLERDLAKFRELNRGYVDRREPTWARFKRNYFYKPLLHLGLA